MRQLDSATSQLVHCKLLALIAISLLFLPILCYSAELNSPAPATSACVYVGWFSGSADFISGFAVSDDGSAQTISGSPFNLPSFNLTVAGSHIFGDDLKNIATFGISSDGALQETSVVNGLAFVPDPGDQIVYALNPDRTRQSMLTVDSCGSCNSEILLWSIGSNGQLSYVAAPMPPSGPPKWQGVMTFSPDNRYVYSPIAQDFGIWRRNSNGSLTSINPGPVYAPPLGNLQQQVCNINTVAASAQGYITLAWYGGSLGCNSPGYILGNYTVSSNGGLRLVPGSGITPQVTENAMAYDPTGAYLVIAGAGIQVLKLTADGTLTPLGTPVPVPGLKFALWDNSNHVYALSDSLYIFNFDGQNLTQAPGSPYHIENAVSLAVVPTT